MLSEAPHIVIFCQGDKETVTGIFIVADTVSIYVSEKGGLMGAILKLIATYYIFYLNYPRCHNMLLAILQEHIMGEPFPHKKNPSGFIMFTKQQRKKIQDLEGGENDD